MSRILQLSYGSEFHDIGPATENACSPSLVLVGGTIYDTLSVDEHSPCHQGEAAVFWTMSADVAWMVLNSNRVY